MKNMKKVLLFIIVMASYSLSAQMIITTDGSNADVSAILEVKSTEKGFLPPRMTETQIQNIASPANALMVFNTSSNKLFIYISNENAWKEIKYGTGKVSPNIKMKKADSTIHNKKQFNSQIWTSENPKTSDYSNEESIHPVTDNDTVTNYNDNEQSVIILNNTLKAK